MTTLKTVTIAAALLVGGASLAMAQNGLPTGGQSPVAGGANGGWYPGYAYSYGYAAAPLYDYAAPAYGYAATAPLYDYAAPASGYAATAPLYNYAAPAYGYAAPAYSAPATAGTTVIIITPAPAYTAPTAVSRPLYSYAPGYWGGYGRWRAGYWWR
jgi:hypothetical protein